MEDVLLLQKIVKIIEEKKGEDIVIIDVKGISSICDYMLIAQGNIKRHTKTIAKEIVKELKKENIYPFRVEGEGDWIVIDYGFIIVHIFVPFFREKYQLEKLWSEGKMINLKGEL